MSGRLFRKRKDIANGGIVELNKSLEPDHTEWISINIGILYFQKDYQLKGYFFRLFDYKANSQDDEPIWEMEMPNGIFDYSQLNETFHYFQFYNDCYVGFNFSSEKHANKFYKILLRLKNDRECKKEPVKASSSHTSTNLKTSVDYSRKQSIKGTFVEKKKIFGSLFSGGNKSNKSKKQSNRSSDIKNSSIVDKMKGALSNMIDTNRLFELTQPSTSETDPNSSNTSLSAHNSYSSLTSSNLAPSSFTQLPSPPILDLKLSSESDLSIQKPTKSEAPVINLNDEIKSFKLKKLKSCENAVKQKESSPKSQVSIKTNPNTLAVPDMKLKANSPIKNKLNNLFQGGSVTASSNTSSPDSLKPPLPPPRSPLTASKTPPPPVSPKPTLKKTEAPPPPISAQILETKKSSSIPPPAPPPPPPMPAPGLPVALLKTELKPVVTGSAKPQPSGSTNEDLLNSIKNFKGFANKISERQPKQQPKKLPPPPSVKSFSTSLNDQLRRELDNRQAFLKDSDSDESDSGSEWSNGL